MDLKVIEVCQVKPGKDGISEGTREYCYLSSFSNFNEAVVDLINDFNPPDVYNSKVFFDGTCISSHIVAIMTYNDESCIIDYTVDVIEEDSYSPTLSDACY